MIDITPIELINDIYVKRDDLFEIAGVRGGKARTCWYLSQKAKGLVTAGSRHSPQILIVSNIAFHLQIPAYCHTASGELTEELKQSIEVDSHIIQHKPGYNSVIIKRAIDQAKELNYTYIPFGMECTEAIDQTSKQVIDIPKDINRIVVTVGSGMSLLGLIKGCNDNNINIPILGIVVGANPSKRIEKYKDYVGSIKNIKLINSEYKYYQRINNSIGNVSLDPIYESKCLKYLKPKDLFWVIGRR